jgi:hypothetical protein
VVRVTGGGGDTGAFSVVAHEPAGDCGILVAGGGAGGGAMGGTEFLIVGASGDCGGWEDRPTGCNEVVVSASGRGGGAGAGGGAGGQVSVGGMGGPVRPAVGGSGEGGPELPM